VIDDNSNPEYVSILHEVDNIQYIISEFKGAGEILPYYYLHKHRFFPAAIILHDSVFFHTKIKFELLHDIPIMPIWHFNYSENIGNCMRLMSHLNNTYAIKEKVYMNPVQTMGFRHRDKWHGCFGAQAYINLSFLNKIFAKYNLTNMLKYVRTRTDRCSLERIMGAIFHTESHHLDGTPSLLGDIWKYEKWGTSYDEYMGRRLYRDKPLVKVWTGR